METIVQQKAELGKNGKVWLNQTFAGPICMTSAALIFTMMSLLIKQMDPKYTVWHIGFIRLAGGFVLINALWGLFSKPYSNPYKSNNTSLLILRGFTGLVAFICYVMGIRSLPISTNVVIFYSYPVFAAIFGAIIYKERIGLWQLFCIFMVIAGVAVLFDFKVSTNFFGQCMAIMAGVFAGLAVILVRELRETNGPVIIYLYFCTVGAIITTPMFILNPVIPVTLKEWSMIIGIVLTSLTAQLLMNQGFSYCRGWEGGIFLSSETVFTASIGIMFLGDPVSWRFWVGGCLIIGSGLFLNWLKARIKKG